MLLKSVIYDVKTTLVHFNTEYTTIRVKTYTLFNKSLCK